MSSQTVARPHVQIAHVLFIDVVGYSKLLINEQQQIQLELNEVVRGTEQFRIAEAEGHLTRLPTGDGMALVFFTTPEAPVQCALEISEALPSHPRLKLRMGVHSGPISNTTDVNNQANIAGSAINVAERVMSCGDAGHILLSRRVADDLGQYAEWQEYLHDLGEVQVKHGETVGVVNLYTDHVGNPALPEKIREARQSSQDQTHEGAGQPSRGIDTRTFFEEVRRRKVYRVAVAYAIVAGGIIQIASAVFPAWELPNWSLRLIIVLLLAGFPIALIFAWIFDITPSGIQRTSAVEPHRATKPQRRRNMMILAGTGAAMASVAGLFLLPRASAHKLDKSIAVLPFENFSDDKDSGYFADGIQDDILTNLAKIRDLKVISRTSVMGYRGQQQKNAREIGKSLGVSAILEGSVRTDRKNNRVRVNVQLINANNDEHLWAEDYDRDLNDVFAIQTDLAQKIANELQAKLSPSEKAELAHKPTENGEAYLAFIQARNLYQPEDKAKLEQAEQLYERALQLDPNFALAAACYGQQETWMYRNFDPTPARIQKARSLAQRALQLQPELPEGHLALGFCYYYGDANFEAALREFETAQRGLPNESGAYLAIGAIQRRQGRWPESTANLEKAAALSPNETWALQNLAFNYQMVRDFEKANKTVDRALEMAPSNFALWEIKSTLALQEKGDFSIAERCFARLNGQPLPGEWEQQLNLARSSVALLQRRFTDAVRFAEEISDDFVIQHSEYADQKYVLIGAAKKAAHDEAGAREAFLRAKASAEKEIAKAPNDGKRYAELGPILAWLGDRDAALAAARRGTELLPESKDAFDGPKLTEGLAQTHAILGDAEEAVSILDGLLARPSTVSVQILKLNPIWDRIRDHPRFQELLQKYSAKT